MPAVKQKTTTASTSPSPESGKKPLSQSSSKKKDGAGKQSAPAAPSSKKGGKKAAAQPAEKPIVYDTIGVRLFMADAAKNPSGVSEPLTAETAKQLLGWQEESENIKFSNDYLFTDRTGKKIRCFNNTNNRPFRIQLAEDYMLEILRQKWKMNFETIKLDKYGQVHDGQHRLVGLIFAVQEWVADLARGPADRRKLNFPEDGWRASYWPTEPVVDALLGTGMEATDDVVNTIGTGRPRTLSDVLYRSVWFSNMTEDKRLLSAKVLAMAIRTLTFRIGYHELSFAPKMPHSESIEFVERHERLLEATRFIVDEAGDKKLSQLIPLGYATALLYLMGCSGSELEKYDQVRNESVLDWNLWSKAQDFWVDMAGNGKVTEFVREALINIPADLGSGGLARDIRCGTVIKGWSLYSDGEPVALDDVKMEVSKDEFGQPTLTEAPRLGGIDIAKLHVDT